MARVKDLQKQLELSLAECARLREENARLRSLLGLEQIDEPSGAVEKTNYAVHNGSPAEEKVALFRSLFRGRENVYPVRWEAKNGRSGYSPACRNEWNRPVCGKPGIKCAECAHRELLPVTGQVIYDHLSGKHTIGVYPLLPDETCWFLAADFDKASWPEDVTAFLQTCAEMDVPAALERSRSGNGGHVWIFFAQALPSTLARKLGCALLTRTMEKRHQLGLDSYDRFFPNQDTLPKGGFGNLIALPLQRGPRQKGNTLFLDRNFQPYPDQWEYLSTLRRMPAGEVEAIVTDAAKAGAIIGVRASLPEEDGEEDPWLLPPSKKRAEKRIFGPIPEKVRVVQSNLLYIEKEELPPALLNRLIRLAAFQNQEFYKAQAMRLPTFGKPRIIQCADDFPRHVGLPRGCLDEVAELFSFHSIRLELSDQRFPGKRIEVEFRGSLRPLQQLAADEISKHDTGILCATTAFGKTVVGAWLIAARKVNTLILVHRRQLLDQWRERLAGFLSVPLQSIGQIGGGKARPTGMIDIGIMQSLNRKGEVKDLVAEYGQVIVDECHHLSAFSFEQVLKQVKAKYVTGLTATPVRKDGHHPIIMMQCGPIRFRVSDREQAAARPFEHIVVPRPTDFCLLPELTDPGIQEIYAALVADAQRNEMILADLQEALAQGRSPLLLTERVEHLDYFAERLRCTARHVLILRGGMGARQRRALAEKLTAIPEGEERVLLSTGRYIGEGFDDARLDTLFLVLPVSWRGTLQQYAGRLHRLHDRKRVVQIYDYVDARVPVLAKMFERRIKGYKAIGYSIRRD